MVVRYGARAAAIVAGSGRADQRVIVLLNRPQGAPIDGKAARIHAQWRVVPGFAATVDDAELQQLLSDPDVLSVEPDLSGNVIPVPNDGQIGLNGGQIGLGAVQALGYDGTGSTVAVLGTGVSPHPDLKDRIIEERCYCAYANNKGCCPNGASQQSGSGSARDDLPHETGVAVALLRQIDRQLTPDAIEEVLESTGRPIVDSRNGVTTPRLDLFAAVMKLRLNAPPSLRSPCRQALTRTKIVRGDADRSAALAPPLTFPGARCRCSPGAASARLRAPPATSPAPPPRSS